MSAWTGSWAFWAGLASAAAGAASALAGALSGRKGTPAPAGSTERSGAASRFIEGRVGAIVAMESPATGRDCVQYHERVTATVPLGDVDNLRESEARETLEEITPERIVDRAVGVFLVESEAGKAVVWPGLGDVSYAEGWTERDRDDGSGERDTSERVLLAGATVTVLGTPGTLADMMAAMTAAAEDLPTDLLTALQTRAELGRLPCYWPRGDGLAVEEEGAVLDEGDEPAGPVLHYVFSVAALLLSAVLLACAYKRLL